ELLDLGRDREQRRRIGADRHKGDVSEREDAGVAAEDLQAEHDDQRQKHLHRRVRVEDVPEGVDRGPRDGEHGAEEERRPDSPRRGLGRAGGRAHEEAAFVAVAGRRRRCHSRTFRGRLISPSGRRTRMAITTRKAKSCVWLFTVMGRVAPRALMIAPRTKPPRAAPARLPRPPMTTPTKAISSGPWPMSGATAPVRKM